MNILVVCSGAPRPMYGAGTRNFYLLHALARRHSVSVLALMDRNEKIPFSAGDLRDVTDSVEIVYQPSSKAKRAHQLASLALGRSHQLTFHSSAAMQTRLDAMLARRRYDAILFEGVQVAGLHVPPDVATMIDEHNIEHELLGRSLEQPSSALRRMYNRAEYRALRRGELERCEQADVVTVCSEREREALQALLPGRRVEVVANGVDVSAFVPAAVDSQVVGRVVFTGTMHYQPNVQGALYFARRCWPRVRAQVPEATWHIVGAGAPPEVAALGDLPGVTVTGWVPQVQPHLAAASVAIAPLLAGGGTRLKILEALAAGKAVVSTPIGSEGIALTPGVHLLHASDPAAFADAVVALLGDPDRRQVLGAAGRALVEAKYSWERVGDGLVSALEMAIQTRLRRSAG